MGAIPPDPPTPAAQIWVPPAHGVDKHTPTGLANRPEPAAPGGVHIQGNDAPETHRSTRASVAVEHQEAHVEAQGDRLTVPEPANQPATNVPLLVVKAPIIRKILRPRQDLRE